MASSDLITMTTRIIPPQIRSMRLGFDSSPSPAGASAHPKSLPPRLILNEICTVYERPYFDLASEIMPAEPPGSGPPIYGEIRRVTDGSASRKPQCARLDGGLNDEMAISDS